MKLLILVFSFLFLGSIAAQKDFCHPRKIKRSTSKRIKSFQEATYQFARTTTCDSFIVHLQQNYVALNHLQLKPLRKYLLESNCRAFRIEDLENAYHTYTFYKLTKKDTCLSDMMQPIIDNYQLTINRLKANQSADTLFGVYIPKDLNDCFDQLNNFWTDSVKLDIKSSEELAFVTEANFGIGMWMRNNWGLWGASRLSTYFSQLKIYHPDDMSTIILTSYHRHLNDRAIKLEEQLLYYYDFWKDKE